MKGIKLCRKQTVEGVEIALEFDVNAYKWLVKNFTEGKIYVAFESGVSKNDSILIPPGCAQVIETRNFIWGTAAMAKVYVLPESTSEDGVEIQALTW